MKTKIILILIAIFSCILFNNKKQNNYIEKKNDTISFTYFLKQFMKEGLNTIPTYLVKLHTNIPDSIYKTNGRFLAWQIYHLNIPFTPNTKTWNTYIFTPTKSNKIAKIYYIDTSYINMIYVVFNEKNKQTDYKIINEQCRSCENWRYYSYSGIDGTVVLGKGFTAKGVCAYIYDTISQGRTHYYYLKPTDTIRWHINDFGKFQLTK